MKSPLRPPGSHARLEPGPRPFDLLEEFAGTHRWDDAATLKSAYERHYAEARKTVPPHRLLEWRTPEGWAPICRALNVPVLELPFPHIDLRSAKGE